MRFNIMPVCLVMNEERYITRILDNVLAVFPHVCVADTGSTDDTLNLLDQHPNAYSRIHIWRYKNLSLRQVGLVRQEVGKQAHTMFGSEWMFMVDGDEYYYPQALEYIDANPMPPGKRMGFARHVTVDQDENGDFWEMSDYFSRTAIFPIMDKWVGEYPWEMPESFNMDKEYFHYWPVPTPLRTHALHLHRLTRSSKDADVPYRLQKQKQFSMQDQQHTRVVRLSDTDKLLLL
jgi:glycosyltransferase involved in cell wall biosynthesis